MSISYQNNVKYSLKNLKDPNIEYSNNMQDVYKNTKECNASRKCNSFIVFDDMTADMINNKNLVQ